MFSLVMLFITLPVLYFIYGLLGRTLKISGIDRKAVLITGCGSGFGKELVKRCLQNGLTVFAGCQFKSNIKELEESYSSISQGRLHAFQMDVTDDESVRNSRKIVDAVLKEKNLVFHALVNNAGVRGNLFYDEFLTLDDYKEVWDVNLFGVIRVTQTFRDLIKKSRGRIVICTSACTMFITVGNSPYTCAKSAVQAYSIVNRHELQPFGVDVVEIAPAYFKTEMANIEAISKEYEMVWYRAPQKLRDEYGHDCIEKVKKYMKEVQPKLMTMDTTWVIDAYYEAIVAKRPKLSYRIGWHALLIFYPFFILPLRLQLYVVKFMVYMTGLSAITTKTVRPENPESKDD